MAKDEKKKSIFDKAIDALTNRDEKEAAAKAAAEKAAAEQAAREAEARRKAAEATREALAARVKAEKEAAEKAAQEKAAREKAEQEAAAKRAADAQARAMMEQARLEEEARKKAAELAEAAKPKFIGEYTIAPNDTLSHVALKYYGNANREYWMLIYEANKEVIGSNPGIVRVGTVLKIPELPDELKKK